MAINFPATPVDGQSYIDPVSGNRYIYYSSYGFWRYAANNDVIAAFFTANTSYAHANAAFLTANQSFTKANTANNDAIAAFVTANQAFSKANTANSDAIAAFVTANIAYAHANAAFDKANIGGSSSVNVGYTQPVNNVNGSLWWNSNVGRLLIFYTDTNSSQWVDTSPSGEVGPIGPIGPSGNIELGTVTTGNPGSMVIIDNSGNGKYAIFDFTIPRGNVGVAGNVQIGTVTTGAPGSSAIIDNSGNGSYAIIDFTIPRGNVGSAGNVQIGTVTTGAPSTSASVTNSGNGTHAILDITIPRGNPAPRSVVIESPSATEKVVLYYNRSETAISEIRSVLAGSSTPSVTFSIRYAQNVLTTGTEVVTGGITTTNVDFGLSTTSFNNGTIPANAFVWLTTTAVSGTVNQLHVSIVT